MDSLRRPTARFYRSEASEDARTSMSMMRAAESQRLLFTFLPRYITQEGAKLEVGKSKVPTTVTNAVSWRSEGIKYKKNEVFIDVIESINVLVRQDVGIIIVICVLHAANITFTCSSSRFSAALGPVQSAFVFSSFVTQNPFAALC